MLVRSSLNYYSLKYGQEYVERGIDYYETRYKEKVVKNLIKKAQEFGYILVQQE
ncbi:hypothetical protein JR053_05065 [Wolbachia endosymbiont of Nasonia vitripennis]|uniref:hypothetical protein n=1 Tax=Wolbachia endosymbiont of Nasonia vitripennis TaxID=180837 RepID=UPI003A8BFB8C